MQIQDFKDLVREKLGGKAEIKIMIERYTLPEIGLY